MVRKSFRGFSVQAIEEARHSLMDCDKLVMKAIEKMAKKGVSIEGVLYTLVKNASVIATFNYPSIKKSKEGFQMIIDMAFKEARRLRRKENEKKIN